jgi:hypothetical protein
MNAKLGEYDVDAEFLELLDLIEEFWEEVANFNEINRNLNINTENHERK